MRVNIELKAGNKDSLLEKLIRRSDSYLVFGSVTPLDWPRGWKIFKQRENVLRRTYDVSDVVVGKTDDGIKLREFSGEAEDGAVVYVIRLSRKERKELLNKKLLVSSPEIWNKLAALDR